MLFLKNIELKDDVYVFDVCIDTEKPYQMKINKWNTDIVFSNLPKHYKMYERLAKSTVLANYYEWFDGKIPHEYEVMWY